MADIGNNNIADFTAVPTHGGQFVQYNVSGSILEITAKYHPPIMRIGQGAYDIHWAPEILLDTPNYTAAIDVWSVGCIFMELMNRKPLFPGRDHVHQMCLLTELLGTPTDSVLGFVRNEEAKRYIQKLPLHPRSQ